MKQTWASARRLIAGFVLVLLGILASESAALGFLATPNQSNPDRHNQESKPIAQPPGTPSPSGPFGNSPTPRLQQDSNERQANLEKTLNYFGKIFGDPLAVLTIILIGVLIWHALLFRGTLKASTDTAQRQLRAYVHFETGKLLRTAENALKTDFVFRNFGQTPAYDVRIGVRLDIAGYPWDDAFPAPDLAPGRAIVGPRGALESKIQRTLTPQEAGMLATPQFGVWVRARIDYRDAFGRNRYTNFRAHAGGPVRDENLLTPDSEGNNAN